MADGSDVQWESQPGTHNETTKAAVQTAIMTTPWIVDSVRGGRSQNSQDIAPCALSTENHSNNDVCGLRKVLELSRDALPLRGYLVLVWGNRDLQPISNLSCYA